MPIPTRDDTATRAAERIRQLARMVRLDCVKYVAQCDSASVNAHDLINGFAFGLLQPAAVEWATQKAVPGVAAALIQMFPGTWANEAAVTADLDTAQSQIASTMAYVVSNTPKNAQGYVLVLQVNAQSNGFTPRLVTQANEITPLRAQLVTLRDAFSA